MSILELTHVTKSYGSHPALSDVSLSLPAGTALGLLGPNGAGKSTVLRLLLGFVRATAGSVSLQGCDPQSAAARRGVGYLPERLTLPAHKTIRSFLRLHGRLAGLSGVELEQEIDAASLLTGVRDRMGDRLGELSKGLSQRVGFAQAFLGHPSLLLLDEPTSGLDPIGMREARDWISAAAARGCSVLISSHLLSEVELVCDRVVILHNGAVRAAGAMNEVVREGEQLEDAFIRLVQGSGQVGGPGAIHDRG
jgi:ABC-2 type transport system ATP-binding protein